MITKFPFILAIIVFFSPILVQAEVITPTIFTSTTSPVISSLSTATTSPGIWIVIKGQNLLRAKFFVDGLKVPLANLIFTDPLGREVKYRVQDLDNGYHHLQVWQGQAYSTSTRFFIENRTSISVADTDFSPSGLIVMKEEKEEVSAEGNSLEPRSGHKIVEITEKISARSQLASVWQAMQNFLVRVVVGR